MARRRASGGGSGCLVLGVLAGLPVIGGIVAAAVLALAAPVLVPFLLRTDRAQFTQSGTTWWWLLGAAPVTAFALVVLVSPAHRWGDRVPGRGRPGRTPARRPPTSRRRRARFVGRLVRAVVLLLVVDITALILSLDGNVAQGPHAATQTFLLVGGGGAAGAVVLLAIRTWDRRFPPGERFRAVTIQAVQKAAAETETALRTIRADNRRVSRQAAVVQAQLQTATKALNFASLRELHYESRSCADSMYRHYDLSRDLVFDLSGILLRARMTAGLRLRSEVDPKTGRRIRPDRAVLTAAVANLARTRAALSDEVANGRATVKTLNSRTAELKTSIRDNCGEEGRRWYGDLETRTEARRQAAGHSSG